jgi:hypothetical protein
MEGDAQERIRSILTVIFVKSYGGGELVRDVRGVLNGGVYPTGNATSNRECAPNAFLPPRPLIIPSWSHVRRVQYCFFASIALYIAKSRVRTKWTRSKVWRLVSGKPRR